MPTYATRRSALALAQSRSFLASLRAVDPTLQATELEVVTTGDRIQDKPLADIGGKGLFVKEIEEALLERRADFAVHSIKDVPAVLPEGLVIACVPERADARDVLVAPRYRTVARLPPGARVGTSSLRRAVLLKARRPDLVVAPMRGNVDTRLRKVESGDCDAILLALAGLSRLGRAAQATEVLGLEQSLPAVGQGALGIECREDDATTRALLARVHHLDTAFAVAAERGVLVALGGDCKTPLGANAYRSGDRMRIASFVAEPDGSGMRRAEREVPWPASELEAHEVGRSLGHELLR